MENKRGIKALGLLSGGLDSTLAVKLMLDQGVDVVAVKFTSPFCLCDSGGRCYAAEAAKKFNVPILIVDKGREYLRILRNPKHGYGSGMNPCIDCRIYMLKKAKAIAKRVGAKFIFTGEVLDERPMSQHFRALRIIERESGLEGKILRPLSAKLLPETEAERKGWVDRSKLLDIRGRSRRRQMGLAKEKGITDYPCPSGGCLLTYKEFARKVKDLFEHKKRISLNDILLLKVGRHFRLGKNKIIVGRDKAENERLMGLKGKHDYAFAVLTCGSPITLLQGPKTRRAIETAASLTARYSDAKTDKVVVNYGRDGFENSIEVRRATDEELSKLRI